MSRPTALLTFSIGPVQTFIAQARRIADQWAGSALLSALTARAADSLRKSAGCELVFPYVAPDDELPEGMTNRFVVRVPCEQADELAARAEREVRSHWAELVAGAEKTLRTEARIEVDPAIWTADSSDRQTDGTLRVAWSWVEEGDDYAAAAEAGARLFAASRMFRPFSGRAELGEKCAVCGLRTALPNGRRKAVREAWDAAQAHSGKHRPAIAGYFRAGQGRLCMVCATKRLYPWVAGKARLARFAPFDRFQDDESGYFAVVAMDGDRMGETLSWGPERLRDGQVEAFHRKISGLLNRFADRLRTPGNTELHYERLGVEHFPDKPPQLIYAGGEDVLFLCHPLDALPLARAVRARYLRAMAEVAPFLANPKDLCQLTISAAILYAHSKHPAGLLFRTAQKVLKQTAKGQIGRDAVALRLEKRSGPPTEVGMHWDRPTDASGRPLVDVLVELYDGLTGREVASRQIYRLARERATLAGVFRSTEEWTTWIEDRLGRSGLAKSDAEKIARRLTPFLATDRSGGTDRHYTGALRVARFLAREVAT